MGKLILVRHGESVGNRERIFATAPEEIALTELGYQQAREAGKRIAMLFQPELVIASSYLRARETARIIAEALHLPLEIEPQLHERHVGALRGQPYDSVRNLPSYDPRRPWRWQAEGGESFEDVKARVGPILDRLAKLHAQREVVVVSHGGVMSALWSHVTGSSEGIHAPDNCGTVVIEHDALGYSHPQPVDVLGRQSS
ncbi:MAG: histidine phosphatase family protein [Steroidobacter sp.]